MEYSFRGFVSSSSSNVVACVEYEPCADEVRDCVGEFVFRFKSPSVDGFAGTVAF